MPDPTALFSRLDSIAQALAASGQALALIALGSVGREIERVDAYSDLDFFAIVRPGQKMAFLKDLSWLSAQQPVVYAFQNTADGYKVLYDDGIFAEFAVFEPLELESVPYAPGRMVWAEPGVDPAIAAPRKPSDPPQAQSEEWRVGEALSNLYVGMGRYLRGERLSAFRFIQGYAVDRLIELAATLEPEPPGGFPDPFSPDRRVERRFPSLTGELPGWMPGYDATPQAARAILAYLDARFTVNPAMRQRILALVAAAED
jgi:hypothetical protein